MTDLKNRLTEEALQIGNGFKRHELDLKQEKERLELKVNEIKAESDTARIAFQRGLKFGEALRREPRPCPDCWVRRGEIVALNCLNSEGDDLFACGCGYEISVPD